MNRPSSPSSVKTSKKPNESMVFKYKISEKILFWRIVVLELPDVAIVTSEIKQIFRRNVTGIPNARFADDVCQSGIPLMERQELWIRLTKGGAIGGSNALTRVTPPVTPPCTDVRSGGVGLAVGPRAKSATSAPRRAGPPRCFLSPCSSQLLRISCHIMLSYKTAVDETQHHHRLPAATAAIVLRRSAPAGLDRARLVGQADRVHCRGVCRRVPGPRQDAATDQVRRPICFSRERTARQPCSKDSEHHGRTLTGSCSHSELQYGR